MTTAGYKSDFTLTKTLKDTIHVYLILTYELWGVYCEDLGRN